MRSSPSSPTRERRLTTPPTVVSAVLGSSTSVDITFSEALWWPPPGSGQSPGTFSFEPELDVVDVALLSDGKTVRVTTGDQSAQLYWVYIEGIRDLAGNSASTSAFAVFAGTAADTTPPTVTSATALDATHIRVVFSEPISGAGDPTNFSIETASGDPLQVINAEIDGSEAVLTTGEQTDAMYTVSADALHDVAGNPLGEPSSATFRGGGPDVTGPTVVSATAVSSTGVDVVFSEPVDPSAGSIEHFAIESDSGEQLAVVAVTCDGATVHLSTAMQSNATYTLSVANITDLLGNPLGSPTSGAVHR